LLKNQGCQKKKTSRGERIGKGGKREKNEAPESFKLHGCDDVALNVTTDVGNYCNSFKVLGFVV